MQCGVPTVFDGVCVLFCLLHDDDVMTAVTRRGRSRCLSAECLASRFVAAPGEAQLLFFEQLLSKRTLASRSCPLLLSIPWSGHAPSLIMRVRPVFTPITAPSHAPLHCSVALQFGRRRISRHAVAQGRTYSDRHRTAELGLVGCRRRRQDGLGTVNVRSPLPLPQPYVSHF